jgi:hypothetical protein
MLLLGTKFPGFVTCAYPVRVAQPSQDRMPYYHPSYISAAGTSWWNYITRQTEAAYFDFDFGHGERGLDEDGIALVDRLATQIPYLMNCTSKSGKGRHWFVPVNPYPAENPKAHSFNCKVVLQRLCKDLGRDITPMICTYGAKQFIYPCGKIRVLKPLEAQL